MTRPLSLYPWLLPSAPLRPRMAEIAREVAERHGLTVADLRGPRQFRRLTAARHEAFVETYATKAFSTVQIGRFYGDRDHTAVLHGIRRFEERPRVCSRRGRA